MFTYIFISLCFFSIIHCAPVFDTALSDNRLPSAPAYPETLPDIDPFDSDLNKIEYEVRGE